MKILFFIFATALFWGCATNNTAVNIDDNDQIAVCGEVNGQKQTYPTIGDLRADGAKLLYYEPCYE